MRTLRTLRSERIPKSFQVGALYQVPHVATIGRPIRTSWGIIRRAYTQYMKGISIGMGDQRAC